MPDRALRNLLRRVARARRFPRNTCGASRHLHLIATELLHEGGERLILEDRRHAAESMLAVLESLWKLRTQAQHKGIIQ